MKTNEEIKNWYNSFSKKQKKTGVNLRHYTIMNNAISLGMKRHHLVLEIGCGIGTLTGLLNNFIRSGKIVATDISNESIDLAKTRLQHSHKVDFCVTDMQSFEYDRKFDFIILPDVLEHIPLEYHHKIFNTLSANLKKEGKVLINIPHPEIITHFQQHAPEKLQIIDQALDANKLIEVAYANGFLLEQYQSYSIFNNQHDYVFIVLKKEKTSSYSERSKLGIIISKLLNKLTFWTQGILH